ncbi:unnamed protein product [Rotaria magnacalcarata]|uniref:Uncharacterized protein n=2 Tax=Rotaria magnacalcarata TaxID=392030 RepID=A0A8S2JBS1_9BILA|nr:unnamed protein product [Rotaria magnacalcarata]
MTSLKAKTEDDDASIISFATSNSKISTTSSVVSLSNIPITTNIPDEIPSKVAEDICNTLELDCTEHKDQIISDLLTKGRRVLQEY